jgi:hypothetical protein
MHEHPRIHRAIACNGSQRVEYEAIDIDPGERAAALHSLDTWCGSRMNDVQ